MFSTLNSTLTEHNNSLSTKHNKVSNYKIWFMSYKPQNQALNFNLKQNRPRTQKSTFGQNNIDDGLVTRVQCLPLKVRLVTNFEWILNNIGVQWHLESSWFETWSWELLVLFPKTLRRWRWWSQRLTLY